PGDRGKRTLDHDLGLRPRDEGTRVRLERQPAKVPVAEDVRERLAPAAPLHEEPQAGELGLGEGVVVALVPLEARAAQPVREDQLGVETRGIDALAGEEIARPGQDLPERQPPPPSSARRCASAVRASVNSSRSPASTSWRRALTPTRWSVTRSCGKL